MTTPLLADGNFASILMFIAGCGLLTAILLRRSYRYFNRRPDRGGTGPALVSQPRPATAWDGAHRDASARLEREKVELYEMARDANGQLTTKIAMLEQLVETSGRQIKRLEELLAESSKR